MAKTTSNILIEIGKLTLSPVLRLRGNVLLCILLELIGIAFGVGGPYLLKCLVDTLGPRPSPSDVGTPLTLTLGMLVTAFVATWCGGSVISTVRMVYTARVIDGLNAELATRALRYQLPVSARNRESDSGHLLGLLERLPFSLNVVCEGLIWRTIPMFIQVFACLAVVAGLIPLRYVLIMAVMLCGFVMATWYGAVRQRRFAGVTNTASGAVSQNLGDVLRNARRVTLNGTLDEEVGRIRARFLDRRGANERMWWSLVHLASLQYGAVGLGLLVLLVLGGMDVAAGRMTVGDFVLLQAYAVRLTTPLSSFGFTLSQAGVSLANLGEVLEIAQIEEVVNRAHPVGKGPAALSFKNVDFHYGPGLPGISDIDFAIEAGTFNVIVGPNGSGKSTLAQVLAGVMAPSSGTVLVNGADLGGIPHSERYRHIMYVPQFIGLFHRSLGENALYPPTVQTPAEVQALLNAWRFYEPGREIDFNMVVGEQAERLSGGQIQKLELARLAGVKVPAIILDESTSSLDPASEACVIDSLILSYGAQTTIVFITHRPALAEIADQVLFMSDGRLEAKGRHADLLGSNKEYARLWSATDGEKHEFDNFSKS